MEAAAILCAKVCTFIPLVYVADDERAAFAVFSVWKTSCTLFQCTGHIQLDRETRMIYPSRFALALSVFALAAAVPTCAHATNLVTNGNFSSGFSGWTFSETASYPWSTGGAGDYASDGCIGQPCITGTPSEQSYLYQDVSTVAGDTYTLSFEFSDVGNAMELQALFGGTIAEDLLNIGTTPLTTYTILNLTATSSLTELEFLGRQDPGYDELTDVSLTLSGDGDSAVPEPGTIGMVGTGVLGLFGVARRKRLFS